MILFSSCVGNFIIIRHSKDRFLIRCLPWRELIDYQVMNVRAISPERCHGVNSFAAELYVLRQQCTLSLLVLANWAGIARALLGWLSVIVGVCIFHSIWRLSENVIMTFTDTWKYWSFSANNREISLSFCYFSFCRQSTSIFKSLNSLSIIFVRGLPNLNSWGT